MNFNLAVGLHRQSLDNPERLAIWADGREMTYGALADVARRLATTLRVAGVQPGDRVCVLGSRSPEACASVLGIAWAGATYVPVNPNAPEERLARLCDQGEFAAVVVDARGAARLSGGVVERCPRVLVLPQREDADVIETMGREVHTFDALAPAAEEFSEPAIVKADDLAYIMFTSGTTGVPKGVMISAGSVAHFLRVMRQYCRLEAGDRVAGPTELSFDLSVFDLFMTWQAGASLCVVPAPDAMSPAKFINRHEITVWLSVPSVISMMIRLRSLKPGSLPSLRHSLFLGEPLPLSAALAWRAAAPQSAIDNLYGPTEATVACLREPVAASPVTTPERGIVSIGEPFDGTAARIVGPGLSEVPAGQPGELALAGPQLASGYFRMPELSSSRFPTIGGTRWYLTGDLAYQDASRRFHHLGRLDNQVKVRGHRVELEEIEAHLRAVCGAELVAAVAWPVSHGVADGVVAFIAGTDAALGDGRRKLMDRLPSYMVPTSIHAMDSLPLNANGKVDRQALVAWLGRQVV